MCSFIAQPQGPLCVRSDLREQEGEIVDQSDMAFHILGKGTWHLVIRFLKRTLSSIILNVALTQISQIPVISFPSLVALRGIVIII
ncbi:unnamed protein product, partial [Vitis vinifera]|uniref:Uncharacterized protein n=1 Tax=Vitis vinifera TaxID=29760 RepID=D7TNB3_VITVI